MKVCLFFKNGDEKWVENVRYITKGVKLENNIPVFKIRLQVLGSTKQYEYSEISSIDVYDSDYTWIEDRTDIVCPYCDFRFNDEIKFMGHGEDDFLKYCPNCGKRVK